MPDRTASPSPGGLVELDAGPRLDPAEAVRLRRAVAQLSADHALVGLRVDRVVAFDAAGLGLLLGLHRLARAKGAGLLVVGPDARLLAALRRRGLHRVLVIEMLPGDGDGGAGTGADASARPRVTGGAPAQAGAAGGVGSRKSGDRSDAVATVGATGPGLPSSSSASRAKRAPCSSTGSVYGGAVDVAAGSRCWVSTAGPASGSRSGVSVTGASSVVGPPCLPLSGRHHADGSARHTPRPVGVRRYENVQLPRRHR